MDYSHISFEEFKRFSNYFRPTDDPLRYILVGHMLIEEHLDSYIKEFLPNTRVFSQITGFRFYQKSYLAESFDDREESDWLWATIRKFNEIRNKAAHKLDHPGFNDKVEEFIKYVEANFPDLSSENYTSLPRLSAAIAIIFALLDYRLQLKREAISQDLL
jgi:hypothetical protein